MCGIVGVIVRQNRIADRKPKCCTKTSAVDKSSETGCFTQLIDGLKQLQNRGYDSVGVCTINTDKDEDAEFVIDKMASSAHCTKSIVDVLEGCGPRHQCAAVGIAHTRWATHGPKTNINAHPHNDCFDRFSLVHNGIIDNYQSLKDMLIAEQFSFKSETDTEVIVNLLSREYAKCKDVKKAIRATQEQLSGTFALCILCIYEPNTLYCVRRGSPLLVGVTSDVAIVTSEQLGFNGMMSNYYVIENDDLCMLSRQEDGKIKFETEKGLSKKMTVDPNAHTDLKLSNFPHWTIKEIYEQSDSCSRAFSNGGRLLNNAKVKLGGFYGHEQHLVQIEHLILLGCGTSYHAGLIASHYFKDLCGFTTVQLFDGAEFTNNDIPKNGRFGCILLSQSGETRDLYNCIQIVRNHNGTNPTNTGYLIGVVNVVDSLIAREVDCGVYLNAGREVAVASTKAFTAQLTVLMLIAIWFSQAKEINYTKRKKYIHEIRQLQQNLVETLSISKSIVEQCAGLFTFPSCFILGKGTGEGLAREAALKIKEIAYIHAEGYSSSSLKHGPFALLQGDFPVVILGLDNDHYDKSLNALEEIKSRGAKIIFITNRDTDVKKADYVIKLPHDTKHTGDILSIVPLQLLAYELSVARGLNPDFPRNLAKVVTVE